MQQRIYDESERIGAFELYRPYPLRHRVFVLTATLESGKRVPTERSALSLMDGLKKAFDVPPLKLRVLERRPSSQTEELYGLY